MTIRNSHVYQSFLAAGRGLRFAYRSEKNFRAQVLVGAVALLFAGLLPLRNWEVILVVLLIALVLIMELLNTAVERVMDLLKPRLHQYVLAIKDIMAGAVLLTSLAALIIGSVIFIPHFIALAR